MPSSALRRMRTPVPGAGHSQATGARRPATRTKKFLLAGTAASAFCRCSNFTGELPIPAAVASARYPVIALAKSRSPCPRRQRWQSPRTSVRGFAPSRTAPNRKLAPTDPRQGTTNTSRCPGCASRQCTTSGCPSAVRRSRPRSGRMRARRCSSECTSPWKASVGQAIWHNPQRIHRSLTAGPGSSVMAPSGQASWQSRHSFWRWRNRLQRSANPGATRRSAAGVETLRSPICRGAGTARWSAAAATPWAARTGSRRHRAPAPPASGRQGRDRGRWTRAPGWHAASEGTTR